jgi:hypothetical protein
MNKPKVLENYKCKCGLITVNFDNGAWNTMTESTYKKRVQPLPSVFIPVWCCDGCSLNNYTVENKAYTLFEKKKSVLSWKD